MTALVLHDLGGTSRQLIPMMPVLPDVWAPDLPAHGANPVPDDLDELSLYRLAQTVAEGMPERASEHPLTIIGVGLGAAVGLRIVLSRLHKIDRFVAIRPSFGSVSLPENLTVYPVIAELLGSHPRDAVQRFETSGVFNDIRRSSRAAANEALQLIQEPNAAERRARFSEIPMYAGYREDEFKDLDVASMVIADPTDPVHPLWLAQQWQHLLGAAIRVTPDRGRNPHAVDAWIQNELATYLVGVR
ncbi:MAG TPA: alpha/beta hydrolase [Candidatus Agrococcus pullicola]|uniref:Alpha/beta hydrolase n=1 Tax=Candidatus Agrococcus pullicola TaxID=2838429 RepID=A0A9D2CAH9_9MICO|nr:alpha/beta hydrolase [Candidatus Agrococcus pullicola]